MEARHPLFGAELRAKRAKFPIGAIRRHLRRWAELHWDHVELVLDEDGNARMDESGNVLYEQKTELPVEILGRTSVWIGEAVYNLRSALDYLVYASAVVGNGGRVVKGTQFPIEDDMGVFEGRITGTNPKTGQKVARHLHHVPKNAVIRIRQLQPGWNPPCEWTALLRELSNPDKHRFLTELQSRAHVVAGYHPLLAEVTDDEARKHPHVVVEIVFRESGRDVVDTLDMLQREVRGLVREFEEAFGMSESGLGPRA